jgi:CubicO group peptidase (beta-lactamase class C family)
MSPEPQLPSAAPEAHGVASSAILAFVDAAERSIDSLHSLVLVRHGHILAQGWWAPYEQERPHLLFSLSKSFTSTAIGLAVAEGRLSVEDRVLSFFPEAAPAHISEHLAAMRVRDLLSMVSGHASNTTGPMQQQPDGDWVRGFLALPVEYTPGTHFVYNSGATYMLSAIVQRLTAMTVLEYLRPRLLAPLGIEQATWQSCPRGINVGGWGLSIATGDIARFGQLYLQKGIWHGRRILTEDWVEAATMRQVANDNEPQIDWRQGYGYQFWRCRHGAYRGDGAFGQFCVVMPEQEAVLAITSGVGNMQAVLNLIWEHLLPAMQAAPLPEDAAARARLDQKLAQLALPPQQGQPSSATAARVSGRTYRFEKSDQDVDAITLDLEAQPGTLIIQDGNGTHRIGVGSGVWQKGATTLYDRAPLPVAASGAWTGDDTYVVRLCFTNTPFMPTLTLRFSGEQLTAEWKDNVAFGPTEHPPIVGSAE